MPWFRRRGQVGGAHGAGETLESQVAHYRASPAVASNTSAHAAVAMPASETTTVSTAITQPDVPRNVIVKGNEAGVTGNVVVNGLRAGIALNGATAVPGAKIFDEITNFVVPVRAAGTNTVSLGYGSKLGFNHKLDHNTVVAAYLNKVKEGTLPTVTTSATELESNGFTLNSALDGNQVDVYYWV
jgi:hypothetical protein